MERSTSKPKDKTSFSEDIALTLAGRVVTTRLGLTTGLIGRT